MAIDPALLAALTSGATAGAKTTNTAGSSGIDWAAQKKNQPGAWNLGQSIIDILSTGGYASAGITRKVGENVAAVQRGDLGGLLDLLNPLSVIPAAGKGIAERRTYSQNLKDLGTDPNVATWLGLALDIGLDPTTYITGGTIAGIKGAAAGTKLASAANKANAVVVRSAAEAAAQNLPDISKAYIPVAEPLTQGQKLGNYLTGVLRGHEYSTSLRSAEILNKKLAKRVTKATDKAIKAGDTKAAVLGRESISGIEDLANVSSARVADNIAILNRDELMKTISENPVIAERYRKKFAKYEKATARAAATKFDVSSTTESSAKAAQMTQAASIDPVPAVVKESETLVKPAEQASLEAAIAAEKVANPIDYAELLKKQKVAQKTYRTSASKLKSSYGAIADEITDFASKVTDPATGKKLSEFQGEPDQLIEYIANELSAGRIKLTPARAARFARLLGVSADPQQTKVDLVSKTLVALTPTLGKLASGIKKVSDQEANLISISNQLARAVESGFVNATTENIAAVSGAVDANGVGAVLETATGIQDNVAKVASDIINTELLGTPQATGKTVEELTDDATSLMSQTAGELAEDIGFIESGKFTSSQRNILVPLQAFAPEQYAAAEKVAKKMGITTKELIYGAAREDKAILNNPDFLLSPNAIRLDYLNSEARFNINNKIFSNVLSNTGKSGRKPADLIEEEARAGRGIDNLFRIFRVPVKTVENVPMQLRRDGQRMIGDKLSDGFVPAESHITYSDIAMAALNSGKADVFAALRYPGGKYQNVMPSNFEYAFLKLQQLIASGKTVAKGTSEWDEVKKAFNENYSFNYSEGVKANQVAVDELFIEAPHLKPTPTSKGKTLSTIPGIDSKIDNAIQVMINTAGDLNEIHKVRAAAVLATAVADEMPVAVEIVSGMIQTFAIRDQFLRGMGTLAKMGGNAIQKGAKDIPGWDALAGKIKNLIVTSAEGARLFKDPQLANSVRDMLVNTFMKSLLGPDGAKTLKDLDPITGEILKNTIISLTKDFRDKINTEINLVNALGVTKPSTKLTKQKVQVGMNARNQAAEVQAEGAMAFVPEAVKGHAAVTEQMMQSGKVATDTSSNLPDNFAGNVDPYAAGFENVSTVGLQAVENVRLSEKFMRAMSASFGIGKSTRNVIGGITTWNYNSVGVFRNALTSIFLKYNKDTNAINDGFKVVQEYGKEMAKRIEEDAGDIPFTDWLATKNLPESTVAIAVDMIDPIEQLFGPLGSAREALKLPFFGDELNIMFGMEDFWKKGTGQGFILPPGLGPDGVKYSWADAELDGTFNALELLSGYASAIHAVKTKIGVGSTFSRLFGKTAKEIKDEGLDITKFVKIDQVDEFGKYLNPDSYFDAEQLEKLRYIKDYLMYRKSFGKSAQRVVDLSDMITSFLKASHTTWRPGHHVTSIVGETSMNLLAGVTNPKYYYHSGRMLKEFDPVLFKGDANPFKAYAQVSAPKGMQLSATDFDGIGYVSNKTLKKIIVDGKSIMYAMERFGVMTRAGLSTVEDLDLRGAGAFSDKFFGGVSRANESLAQFSSTRDNFFRVAHFLHELENGGIYGSFEEAAMAAAKKVAEYHPTVGGLSAFERKYMRRAVFFYTWQRLAATKVFELVLERPGVVTIPSKIQYAFAEANGFNPESFGDPWDPNGVYASWNTGNLYGPQFQGPSGKGDAWGFGPAVPQLDILNSLLSNFTVQPGESGLDVLGRGTQSLAGQNLSPLPKWFAELTTGNRVGIGGDISNPLQYALDQVGGVNTIAKLTGLGQDPEKTLTPTEQGEKKARLLTNWFLGQKLQDYSTSQTIKQWKSDQREFMKRLTEQGQ
jgi:hypothetical protein